MSRTVTPPEIVAAWRIARPALWGLAWLSALTNLLVLVGPLYMIQVYDRVLTSHSVPTLVGLSVLAALLYGFLGYFDWLRSRILVRVGQQVAGCLTPSALAASLALPLLQPNTQTHKPLRDVEHIRQFLSGPGPLALYDLPWMPFFLGLIFLFHPVLGLLALVGSLMLLALTVLNDRLSRQQLERQAIVGAQQNALTEAGQRNAEAVRAMGMQPAFITRWQHFEQQRQYASRQMADVGGGLTTLSRVTRMAMQSAVLGLGAWLAIAQQISPGMMVAASIVMARALSPIEQIVANWGGLQQARQSRLRLEVCLRLMPTSGDPLPLPAPNTSLTAQSIAVAAPGDLRALVRDVRFTLTAGNGLGIIGPSGAGKSSLARALVGLWPVQRGRLTLDDADYHQWQPQALGRHIGYLPQEVGLFAGTVAENIARLQPDASADRIIAAARQAGAHDMILSLPKGYDTEIGSQGGQLSAGQRQRLGLARALYGDPFLLVLDEPNANLDSDGEVALTEAMQAARQRGAIVVIIAHRPSALAAVDHVLVLQEGRQTAFGPRDDVLRQMVRSVVAPSSSASLLRGQA